MKSRWIKIKQSGNQTNGLGTLALLSIMLAACEKPVEPPAPPRPALVMTVQSGNASHLAAIVGEVRPRYESAQGFRIAGKIVERKVEIGNIVHKGQVLARLDAVDTSLNTQVSVADVKAAEAEYALADADLQRQRQLYAKKFISASALDSHEASVKTAAARLQQAQSRAAVSGNQTKYTSLVADRDGVVTDIRAEPGQVVSAGEVVAKIADLKQLEVNVGVAESAMKGLTVGMPVVVRMWASREKAYQGKIREIAPSADSVTRTFLVKVSILDIDRVYSPVDDCAVAIGRKPATVTSVPESMGNAVELKANEAAFIRSQPCSILDDIISTAIIASSTNKPSANINAPSDILCNPT